MRPIDLMLLSISEKADQLLKEPHLPPLRPDVRPLAKPLATKKKKAQLKATFNRADVFISSFLFLPSCRRHRRIVPISSRCVALH